MALSGSGEQDLWRRAVPWGGPQPLSQKTLPLLLGAVLAETLLYGIHVILFFICVYFLVARKMRLQWILLGGIIIMFLLATADIAISFHTVLHRTETLVRGTMLTLLRRLFPKFMIYVTNNFIAGMLLIARFYVVWGQRKYLLVMALIPLLVTTGLGYACQISNPLTLRRFVPPFFFINLVMNSLLTILTAGRIWWISRNSSDVLRGRGRQYRVTSAIIVESGLLYSFSIILNMALSPTRAVVISAGIMLRMVSIAPVLMTVQIAIGHTVKIPAIHDKTRDITTFTTNTGVRTSVMLDTIIRTETTGPGDSSMQLTTHASTMDGHDLELVERGERSTNQERKPQ